ncbi:MAG: ATP-binding protein, partial [Calditrichia bacterium]
FQNVLHNALKFHGEEPPQIKICGAFSNEGEQEKSKSSQTYTVFFEDNGIGFDMEFVNQIFQPFKGLHKSEKYEGTGMGLAICRKIMERHKGYMDVISKPGSGSTFKIIFSGPFPEN